MCTIRQQTIKLFLLLFISSLNAIAEPSPELDTAIQFFNSGHYRSAEKALKVFIKSNPANANAYYHLGRLSFLNENLDKAIKWILKAINADRQRSAYYLWLGRAYAKKLQHVNLLKKTIYANKIKTYLEKAVKLAPDNTLARQELLKYYMLAPKIVGGDRQKAWQQARELRAMNLWEGFKACGTIFFLDKQYKKAEQEFLNAITHYPEELQFYFYLGNIYERTNEIGKLSKLCQQAISTIPHEEMNILYYLGCHYRNKKMYDAAFEIFERMTVLNRKDMRAYYEIAHLAILTQRHLELAENYLKAYLQNQNELLSYWLSLTHYRLGKVYQLQNEAHKAREHYHYALKMNPKNTSAQKALHTL